MKPILLDRDPGDDWAEVELYRWQHGNLPGEQGTKLMALSISEGLRGMAKAIEARDESNFPSPFNVMMVLRYAAKIIERQSAPPCRDDSRKIGRNDPCPCGSGDKYKRCCGRAGI